MTFEALVPTKSLFIKRLVIVFVLLMVTACLVFLLTTYDLSEQAFYLAEKFDLVQAPWTTSMKPLKDVPGGYKIILFYTSYFRTMPWPQTRGKEKHLTNSTGGKCKVSMCYISYSRDDYSRSDAVVFHSSAMPALRRLESILWRKPEKQRWVWYAGENPEKTSYSTKSFNNLFDITITYRKDSSILDVYGFYAQMANGSKQAILTNTSFSTGKDRLVLWLASNCVSLRRRVVQEIMKYVHVDVYGKCQKFFENNGSCLRGRTECDTWSRRYKFYLAFENYNCKDYVTEKYWKNSLGHNMVPVVVGGSYNKDIMIPGSYIDILDFPNAKALANYLMYLDKNDTAYNTYFR